MLPLLLVGVTLAGVSVSVPYFRTFLLPLTAHVFLCQDITMGCPIDLAAFRDKLFSTYVRQKGC